MAARILTSEDQSELAEKFENVEHEIGEEVRVRMERLADELETYTTPGGRH